MIDSPIPNRVDTSVPHPARTWDYWAGGKDHFPADRRVGDQVLAVAPELADIARADRRFLRRVVRFLVAEAGVRQFVDVGTGIPSADHAHHVAQAVDPSCRIVYVDHDPLVLVHARALLVSAPAGAVDYLHADLRDPDLILLGAAQTLDLTAPVAILLLGVVEFLPDEQAYAAVTRLVEALPSGGHLVLAHSTTAAGPSDPTETPDPTVAARMAEAARLWNDSGAAPVTVRTPQAIEGFFAGLEVLTPGVVPVTRWRPDPDSEPYRSGRPLPFVGAVGRTP